MMDLRTGLSLIGFFFVVGAQAAGRAETRVYDLHYCWDGQKNCELQFISLSMELEASQVRSVSIRTYGKPDSQQLFFESAEGADSALKISTDRKGSLLIATTREVHAVASVEFHNPWGDAPVKQEDEYSLEIEIFPDGTGTLSIGNISWGEMAIEGVLFPRLLALDLN